MGALGESLGVLGGLGALPRAPKDTPRVPGSRRNWRTECEPTASKLRVGNVRGVCPPPKLLAKAKSAENEGYEFGI